MTTIVKCGHAGCLKPTTVKICPRCKKKVRVCTSCARCRFCSGDYKRRKPVWIAPTAPSKPPRGKITDAMRLTWLLKEYPVSHPVNKYFRSGPWVNITTRRDIDRAMRAGKKGKKK